MHKLIIDTNVLVSHCISSLGFSSKIIEYIVFKAAAEWHISSAVLDEYADVLNRPRFRKKYPNFSASSNIILDTLPILAFGHEPKVFFDIIKDSSDNKFLDLAFIAKADFIITGNTLDFTIKDFYNTKIVTPQEYWNNYRQQ